ncbi:DEAD/DEAH box helicase family protein, partial [Xanthomonas campestris pv. campestris]|nr:DEAD/DEAH box helicase family protein [Xanthomonas campestris pv. campestris]MEB1101743.1 DEAD/DEAH box helicase family protein [Xanthomonas campestris pv. campestris]MEB1136968.1 DEAD/DEAH box helicase family protein [Xanthomonas campestris pv. campestris]
QLHGSLLNMRRVVSRICGALFRVSLEGSQIDWSRYQSKVVPVLKDKKTLRPHQQTALRAVTVGLESADRGKLIMACGTGKTFTSLTCPH